MTQRSRGFIEGYACAVATLIRMEGCANTEAKELVSACFSEKDLAIMDEHDAEVIRPVIKELKQQKDTNAR